MFAHWTPSFNPTLQIVVQLQTGLPYWIGGTFEEFLGKRRHLEGLVLNAIAQHSKVFRALKTKWSGNTLATFGSKYPPPRHTRTSLCALELGSPLAPLPHLSPPELNPPAPPLFSVAHQTCLYGWDVPASGPGVAPLRSWDNWYEAARGLVPFPCDVMSGVSPHTRVIHQFLSTDSCN